MKKLYNFRLEPTLIKRIDEIDGTRTEHVTKALRRYLQSDTSPIYNVEMFDLLKQQITELKQDKEYLQQQNNMLMIAKIPMLSKIKLKLLEKNRGEGSPPFV